MATKVVATAFGGPEVLSVVEVDVPAPGPGEVTVDVKAVGVNPFDHKVISGAMGADPARLPWESGWSWPGSSPPSARTPRAPTASWPSVTRWSCGPCPVVPTPTP